MKFAQNRLYVESYAKCPNCGILLYENPANEAPDTVRADGRIYCSAWCVDWERKREARRREAGEAGS
ncbi:hypothetical protein [Methylobacterium platani]|uniref:Uncharacterized protein n=2 Tax=Methylobacterium platani TaxID=427683 RepID=A0A179S6U5_9HYPH|nr:hypothetical protein [Methylobacterium platani]KMO18438.1 hypothetical protein SQ03_10230 [Methylobacterium platani JCM 14648]OAS20250.1 hypothetical protein A5481_22465 [Methylobacterium platani]